MNVFEGPTDRPRIICRVQDAPGRYKTKLNLTGPAAGDEPIPAVSDGCIVRVTVGRGLKTADLPVTVRFARSVRNAGTVEIIGRNRRAVEEARKVFLTAWQLDVTDTAGTPAASSTAARWAALMLAKDTDGGRGAAR